MAPKPAALRAKYAETLELARPDVHDVFRKEVAAGDGATVVEFFVNTPTAGGADKVVVLRARADATVKAVKAQLAAKSGVAAGALALSWGGKPLWRDGCTIGDYGLRAGATLVATGRVQRRHADGERAARRLRQVRRQRRWRHLLRRARRRLHPAGRRRRADDGGTGAGVRRGARQEWRRPARSRRVCRIAGGADATLDPTTPLLAAHFREQGRLTLLVLGTAGGDSPGGATTAGADIRLLSARKLVAHIDGGGKMQIRQALEAAGTDVFLDAATMRGLLPELETKDLNRCTFSGVVALSYAWVTPADPDPQRAQLQALRSVLVWWMCERARRKLGDRARRGKGDATIQTADFGVFIDFMSMFQPDDTTGATPAYTKPAEQASLKRALGNIGLLYGHAGTVVFKMTKTPLPPGGDADGASYDRRRGADQRRGVAQHVEDRPRCCHSRPPRPTAPWRSSRGRPSRSAKARCRRRRCRRVSDASLCRRARAATTRSELRDAGGGDQVNTSRNGRAARRCAFAIAPMRSSCE